MKVYVVTLGFAPARIFLACMDQVYKTIGLTDFTHLVLNNHYPVDEDRNDKLIRSICSIYGINYFDVGENLGLSAGYNYLMQTLPYNPDSVVIGVDPDTFPITPGWGQALVDVLKEKKIGWATLQNGASVRELGERGYKMAEINGIKVQLAAQPCVNSICGWRMETLKALNGLKEPKKYYGGIECMMFQMIKKLGMEWGYLTDFKEESSPLVTSEELYRKYKWEYAHKNSTQLSFKEWLKTL